MTLASVPALAAILACAALFILLYQYLFPRPAPWKVMVVALLAGMGCTALLVLAMAHFSGDTQEKLKTITSLADALPPAVFRAGLPEEAVKVLAALLTIALFRRNLSAAAAFQIPLFVAVGFAIVENRGYAEAFAEFRMLIAVGRGFMATFIHSLLAMIQGVILMRMIAPHPAAPAADLEPNAVMPAPSGSVDWTRWHIPIVAVLVAAAFHAFHDWGLLPLIANFMRMNDVEGQIAGVPFVIGFFGIVTLFVGGLWALKTGLRRAAALDPIVDEPRHLARVALWRKAGKWVMLPAAVIFVGGLGCFALAAAFAVQQGEAASPPLQAQLLAMFGTGCVVIALFMGIIGWVIRQKR